MDASSDFKSACAKSHQRELIATGGFASGTAELFDADRRLVAVATQTALLRAVESYLVGRGIEFLQVKTLSPAHPDKNYAKTRAFYGAMGFRPLEEFPDLWGEQNPCLQMIKGLGG